MKVIIAGSRNWQCSYRRMQEVVDESGFNVTEVVSGGCRGIDTNAEDWAHQEGIPTSRFMANWEKYGRSAGPKRNQRMGAYADALIALWDGKSRGTLNMINIMRELGKPYHVVPLGSVRLIDLEKSK